VVCLCVCLAVCLYVTGMNPAETAEPIEMPFGMWARVGQHSHVLDVGPDPLGEWAILGWGRGRPIVIKV